MEENNGKEILEDDAKEPEVKLIEHRLPWLTLGLLGGMGATVLSSKFESILSGNLQLVFFIPVIVYMADAVGTQTETIYIRNAATKKTSFSLYLFKESLTGLALGAIFGLAIGLFAFFWFNSWHTALTVGLAMFVNILVAPIMAMVVARGLQKERTDPALGAGPFTTVLQDLVSLGIYFMIASVIIF